MATEDEPRNGYRYLRQFGSNGALAATILCVACGADRDPVLGARPLADTLVTAVSRITHGWAGTDSTAFEQLLSASFVAYQSGYRIDKTGMMNLARESVCDVKRWEMREPEAVQWDSSSALLVYRGEYAGSCRGRDGRASQLLSPVRAVSVFLQVEGQWLGAFHSEHHIAPSTGALRARCSLCVRVPRPALSVGVLANQARLPQVDPAAGSLIALHEHVWRAAVAGDTAAVAAAVSPTISVLDMHGRWIVGRDAAVSRLGAIAECDGASGVALLDPAVHLLRSDLRLITGRAAVHGACIEGTRSDRYQAAVWRYEEGTWRLLLFTETEATT